jgi:hypothetical protein
MAQKPKQLKSAAEALHDAKVRVDPKTIPVAPAQEDQKSVPAAQAKDQKDAPASTKKSSSAVQKWKAVTADKTLCTLDMTITVKPEFRAKNPKRDSARAKAATRFNLYVDGQKVREYIDLCHTKTGRAKSAAHADVRWDYAQGWINCK